MSAILMGSMIRAIYDWKDWLNRLYGKATLRSRQVKKCKSQKEEELRETASKSKRQRDKLSAVGTGTGSPKVR